MRSLWILFGWIWLLPAPGNGQTMYFPPLTGTTWETVAPESLGWCTENIDSLYRFLDSRNTKAFIVLKDGRIAMERYFGGFTRDSIWYWASAGKTITAFLVGQAQEAGLLKLSDPTSKYLGKGWTSADPAKEDLITIRHQLTMTSGLNDLVADSYCTLPSCLNYRADAGKRWAYHNAPYTLLEQVLENASGQPINMFTMNRLRSRTGMRGLWVTVGYNNVYFSDARSMARFGLLTLNKGIWQQDTLLRDTAYFRQMVTPSQTLNNSYGYLWWLNGQPNHMLPGTQIVFNGPIVPNAPADMVAGLGKDDQKVYVVPSSNLVVVRMGESSGLSVLALSNFDDQLWAQMNRVFCNPVSVRETSSPLPFRVFPNPAAETLTLDLPGDPEDFTLRIFDTRGRLVQQRPGAAIVPLGELPAGMYLIHAASQNAVYSARFIRHR